jgi:hypothetical protein
LARRWRRSASLADSHDGCGGGALFWEQWAMWHTNQAQLAGLTIHHQHARPFKLARLGRKHTHTSLFSA